MKRLIPKSFRGRLIVMTIVIMLPSIMLPAMLVGNIFGAAMQQENQESTLSGFRQAEEQLDQLLIRARFAATSLLKNEAVEKTIFGQYDNALERTILKRDMIAAINACFVPYDFLGSVIFFRENGSMYGTSIPWNTFSEYERHPFTQSEIYQKALTGDPSARWPGGMLLDTFSPEATDITTVPLSSRIMICGIHTLSYRFSGQGNKEELALLFALNERSVRACYANLSGNGVVNLLDASGALISGDDISSFGTVPSYYLQIDFAADQGSFTAYLGDKPHQLIFKRMFMTGWMLVKTIPLSVYRGQADRLFGVSLLVGVISAVFIITLYSVWASRFTRPFRRMSESLLRARQGDLTVHMDEHTNIYEFRLMRDQFNRMLESMDDLIKQNERILQNKLILEMQNLQSQINPHFLYNSIASIRWVAEATESHNVSRMLISLTELMRPIFSEWITEWPLGRELVLLEHYLMLMKLRYIGMIEFGLDIPDACRGIPVPRFILQPLFENCCEHGTSAQQVLHISLSGNSDCHILRLTMTDDGRGIPGDTLNALKSRLQDTADPVPLGSHGIGLLNVHRRVSLYNKAPYGLEVDSAQGEGTVVTLLIRIYAGESG